MARGTTFGQMVNKVRLEANLDPSPALSLNLLPKIQLLIQTEQERLYDDFDWPFLKITRDVAVAAGQRYYDLPTDLNLERVDKVDYYWGNKWFPLTRGVGTDQYNTYDSDQGVKIEPALRWDVKDTGDSAQIEIWPIPVTNGRLVRFSGIRKLNPILADADVLDLDDMMVSLFVASMIVKDPTTKQELSQRAKKRQTVMQGLTSHTRGNTFVLGGKGPDDDRRPRTPLVAYVR